MAKIGIAVTGLLGNQHWVARFMKYVNQDVGGCWLWTGGTMKNVNGERRACFRCGKHRNAARVSYGLFKGDVPSGPLVIHSCDNGLCVNPEHLRLGTHKDNTADMIARGRARFGERPEGWVQPRGYKRPFMNRVRGLTDDQVREIRRHAKRGVLTRAAIAELYGVTASHVSNILDGTRKAHIK